MSLSTNIFKEQLFDQQPDIISYKGLGVLVGKRTAHRIISEWNTKKRIIKIDRGLYAKQSTDPYYVATITIGGYVSFASALYLHGVKTELDKVIYVGGFKRKKLDFGSMNFQEVPLGKLMLGSTFIERNGKPINVATYPKILFDMCHKPKYADFYSMYRAMNWKPFTKEDWEGLWRYTRMAPLSTIRRIGFICDGKAPKWFLKQVEKLNKPLGVSFLYGRNGDYSKKWRVYDSQYVRRWINEV